MGGGIEAKGLEKVRLTKPPACGNPSGVPKYILATARIGDLEALALDVGNSLEYGVDPICAEDVMYGQRTIPAIMASRGGIRPY